jgi:hypothetical protein
MPEHDRGLKARSIPKQARFTPLPSADKAGSHTLWGPAVRIASRDPVLLQNRQRTPHPYFFPAVASFAAMVSSTACHASSERRGEPLR